MVSKTGSSYRQPGAHLLVFPDGQWHGMLSGGCIEEEVARIASSIFSDRKPSSLDIDTDRWMGCRGTLKLQMHLVGGLLPQIQQLGADRIFGQWLNTYDDRTVCTNSHDPSALLSQPLLPPIKVVVIGGGPDCPPLVQLVKAMDWQLDWICHPEQRETSATSKPRRVHPQSCLADLRPDSRTAVIVMNHHFGRDTAFLEALWSSSVAYLGLLGSRERANNILEQLFQRGLDPDRPLHSPAGLRLGGDGPNAVAISVLSQIQQTMNTQPTNESLLADV
jgi:xanthine dehydrogenase accessory factor